jgi:xyloglucan-specific exo-beta-1,4-glucanase
MLTMNRIFILLILLFFRSLYSSSQPVASPVYEWNNLTIGGGGYVTGVYIHPKNADVVYIRTDVGGAFRFDKPSGKMVQLLNWASVEESNLYGVYGLALDPDDQNHLFISAGRYPFASPSDVFESFDTGKTWYPLGLNQPFGANRHPEKIGNKLCYNALNKRELWCATYGQGLWIYNIQKKKWHRHTFDFEGGNIQSIAFANDGKHVFVSTVNSGIFYSENQGADFQRMKGYDWDNSDIGLSNDGSCLFATSLKNGVWRFQVNLKDCEWENITPNNEYKEYRTITCYENQLFTAPAKPMGALKWGFYISDNNGNSWKVKPVRIEQSIEWHPQSFPGSAISDITVDPNNTDRLLISDWYSVFETKNINSDTVVWSNRIAAGHEEVVCLNMAAIPENDKNISLYSAHADIGGFTHLQKDEVPYHIFKKSWGSSINNLTGLAFCEKSPNVVYALGSQKHSGEDAAFAVSTDYGRNWEIRPAYKADWGWGRVAVCAENAENIVIVTQNKGVMYSENGGETWQHSEGSPDGILSGPVFRYNYPIVSDKVNPATFYLYSATESDLYKSENGGKNWVKISTGLPNPESKFSKSQLDTDYWRLLTVPGHPGFLMLSLANQGLFYSENAGKSWQKADGLVEVPLFGIGAPESNESFPVVYCLAKTPTDSTYWYYRSVDKMNSWQRINDDNNRLGNIPQFIEGDRQVFGKVYIGTNGSGIITGTLKE